MLFPFVSGNKQKFDPSMSCLLSYLVLSGHSHSENDNGNSLIEQIGTNNHIKEKKMGNYNPLCIKYTGFIILHTHPVSPSLTHSQLLSSTPTHSQPLSPTLTHSQLPSPTPSHSHPLSPTTSHSHPLSPAPGHSPSLQPLSPTPSHSDPQNFARFNHFLSS